MSIKTILTISFVIASASGAANRLRRNRLYDITSEFRNFDELASGPDGAIESLLRELTEDSFATMGSMSLSMGTTSTTTSTTTQSSTTTTENAPTQSPPPTAETADTEATTVSTDSKRTFVGDDHDDCVVDASSLGDDAFAGVLISMNVETVSSSPDFLNGLKHTMLAALQDEFRLCLSSGDGRTRTLVSTRRRVEAIITAVTLGETEITDGSCEPSSAENSCHVVHSSVMVHGTNQEIVLEGAGRVITVLQRQDYANGEIVAVHVTRLEDGVFVGDISNKGGLSNSQNNDLDEGSPATSNVGMTAGVFGGLSLFAAALIALAVVALARPRHNEDGVLSDQNEFQFEEVEFEKESSHGSDDSTVLSIRQRVEL